MTFTPAIELHDLTKDFVIGVRGVRLRAIDKVNLVIRRGEIFGLLGANGSGKSTTIKIILGLLKPTSGRCAIFGVPAEQPESRLRLGYLPESPEFYRHLSGRELISFYARLCGVGPDCLRCRVMAALRQVGLLGAADRRVGTYSNGMLQRVGLAQAIVHDPDLLILDEPTAGVDANTCEEFAELLRNFRQAGKTVVITSHVPGELHDLCDRIAFLDRGQLVSISQKAQSSAFKIQQTRKNGGAPAETSIASRVSSNR